MERDPVLYRVEEAANQLGMSRTYVWGLVAKGEIRTVKLGRATRIPASELRRFVARLTASAK